MKRRTLRNRLITAGAVISTAGLMFAGGLPAFADEGLDAPWPPVGPILGDEAQITPTVSVTGWPDHTVFYAGETVTLSVHVDASVVGAPSLEGMLAGLAYEGEALAFGEIDAEGNAIVSVRPLITGTLHLTPFFVGEGPFNEATGEAGSIEVAAVPVTASIWLDSMDDSGTAIGYGGGTLDANAHFEPFCVDDEDEATTDACYATYGVPSGTFTLTRDGETIGEAAIEGPANTAAFADLNADLSEGERPEWALVVLDVPPVLLGSPDSFEVTAEFAADNWFTSVLEGPYTVEVAPLQTELELLIDRMWINEQPLRVNDSEILLTAYFPYAGWVGAAPTGTVEFFANGTSIGEVQVDEDAGGVDVLWTPIEGGNYVLRAMYTPDSLNHLGSQTPEYSVQVIIPPVPNPYPVDPTPDTDSKADDQAGGKSKSLATTGGNSGAMTGLAGASLLLAGATALILAGRKRTIAQQ